MANLARAARIAGAYGLLMCLYHATARFWIFGLPLDGGIIVAATVGCFTGAVLIAHADAIVVYGRDSEAETAFYVRRTKSGMSVREQVPSPPDE